MIFLSESECLCACGVVFGWLKETQREAGRENLDSCLFVCIICIVCLTLCVCLYVLVLACVCVSVCGFTLVHELHICPDSFGSTDRFWAQGLIALLQT